MAPRRCLDCGVPCAGSRCPTHQAVRKQVRNADRPIARAVVSASPACVHCGTTDDLTAGHVLPYAHGGTNEGRRQTECRSCNSRLGGSLPTVRPNAAYTQAR